ncbi:MAG: sigma-54-dependent Fis family transcriptional regulator [Ignavibacterium sp.]|nr:sigma-54-dependent Fis family transcriptional regulator [Ignavibacterium sp.]
MARILLADDSDLIKSTLKLYLSKEKHFVFPADDGAAAIEIFKKERPDLVITDIIMPEADGFQVLKYVKENDPNIPVIMITGVDDTESTIKAIQEGAYDYIEKPIDVTRFNQVVKNALRSKELSEQLAVSLSKEEEEEFNGKTSLVGSSPIMKEIYKSIGRISSSRITVLIQGDSGTGKELIAKMIHNSGITQGHPFIAVNCSALSESLLESELFGHVKGAFTGAVRNKKGKFELAGNGTIFLDEISEISYDLQVKLLRVIQEKEFERVGGESTVPLEARIIAATNKNLAKRVDDGKFREDLFYRLKVYTITAPPLRDRKEDIPALVIHFVKKINKELHKNVRKVPYEVMEMLQEHSWVGNVRELENTLMQAILLSKSDVIEPENVLLKRPEFKINKDEPSIFSYNVNWSVAELEKFHIENVLNEVKGNKQKACKVLGISKPTLYNKLELYGIPVSTGKIQA